MDIIIAFIVGVVAASVAWYLIARNNKKHVAEVLNVSPKVGWDTLLTKLKARLKEKL